MEILNVIGMLIGFLVILFGVIMVYDARKLTDKWFSFHDKNAGAKWFKIGGFLLVIIGITGIYVNF